MARGRVPPCAWCHGTDSAWRRHLVTCPSALAHVAAMRDEALAAILRDVDSNKRPHHETALSPSNMDHHRVISRVTTTSASVTNIQLDSPSLPGSARPSCLNA
jgi:hypothetical protein